MSLLLSLSALYSRLISRKQLRIVDRAVMVYLPPSSIDLSENPRRPDGQWDDRIVDAELSSLPADAIEHLAGFIETLSAWYNRCIDQTPPLPLVLKPVLLDPGCQQEDDSFRIVLLQIVRAGIEIFHPQPWQFFFQF